MKDIICIFVNTQHNPISDLVAVIGIDVMFDDYCLRSFSTWTRVIIIIAIASHQFQKYETASRVIDL